MTCCNGKCNQGRTCPVRQAYIDAKNGAQHALDADLLLSSAAVTGPYRTTKPVKPVKRRPVRRFFRALLDMLMSPRAPRI